MKKRILKVSFLGLFSFGVISIFILNNNERKDYEDYLIKDIQSLHLNYESEENSEDKMDKPEMAGIQDYYATIDPKLKRVPHEKLISAIKETNKKLKSKSELSDRYIWNEVPSNMGGRVRSLMVDPNDSDYKKVWAGSVTGGLWLNDNIYNTDSDWSPVSDVWENLSISSIAYDPNNTMIFYAGTGEPQTAVTIYRESSTRGVGIWKTSDGGETWALIPSTSDFPYISDIVVRNESGQSVIYAGVVSGTYQGEDHSPLPSDGLYRSANGGDTWTQVLPNIDGETTPYSPSDIEIAASGRIFVGTYRNIQGKGGATILYSDDGLSWTVYDNYNTLIEANSGVAGQENIPGRTILASAPSSPNTVYAVIAAGRYTPENWIYYRGKHFIKTTDNGSNWTEKTIPYGDPEETYWATLAWHALTLKVDPNNENIIYAGGLNMHKSLDGGLTWQLKSFWYSRSGYPPFLHADQHSITFKPNSSDTIFFTNDGGVFASYNGASSYVEKNNSFNTLQFYTCDINPDSAVMEFVGGLQDNGTVLYNGSPINIGNSALSGGDGAYCFFDKDGYIITTVYYNLLYIFQKNYNSYSFLDGNDTYYNSGTFICPSDYDEINNIYYANAVGFDGSRPNNILRVTNMTSINSTGTYVNVGTSSNVHFSSVKLSKYSPQNSTNIYLGTQSGMLYKVQNAQATPASQNIGSSQFPTGNISSIAEGKNENELIVTFSNYGVSSVWYTEDGGTNWIEKEGNLPDMPIRWALFDPADTAKVLLATEVGIWATDNIYNTSVTWEPVVNGLANVRVDMLQLRESDNTILAATHGRGLFYCDLEGGISTGISNLKNIEKIQIKVYPNPASNYVHIEIPGNLKEKINISIFDEKGSLVKSSDYTSNDKILDFDITDLNNGIYYIRLQSGNKKSTEKLVVRK